eukprot:360249-Chlamydomonas_euryale.AAC.2
MTGRSSALCLCLCAQCPTRLHVRGVESSHHVYRVWQLTPRGRGSNQCAPLPGMQLDPQPLNQCAAVCAECALPPSSCSSFTSRSIRTTYYVVCAHACVDTHAAAFYVQNVGHPHCHGFEAKIAAAPGSEDPIKWAAARSEDPPSGRQGPARSTCTPVPPALKAACVQE